MSAEQSQVSTLYYVDRMTLFLNYILVRQLLEYFQSIVSILLENNSIVFSYDFVLNFHKLNIILQPIHSMMRIQNKLGILSDLDVNPFSSTILYDHSFSLHTINLPNSQTLIRFPLTRHTQTRFLMHKPTFPALIYPYQFAILSYKLCAKCQLYQLSIWNSISVWHQTIIQ